jgi:hypothetical protein
LLAGEKAMSPREALHRLVDDLPDGDLPTASRVLEALRDTSEPVRQTLNHARLDDEPDEDDADGGLTEARKDAEAGRGLTTEELRRELGEEAGL